MLGLSAFAETTFGATIIGDLDVTVIVSGSGVTCSMGQWNVPLPSVEPCPLMAAA